jgi:Ca2+-binding RTX toxin-like protein
MPTPKSKRTIVLQSSNHDSESGSTTEEFSLGASSVVGKTSRIIIVGDIALPPLLDESTSLLQYDRIKVKKLPYDSESSSLGDAVANSTKVTLKNLIIANGTGGSQDESTESAGQDSLTGEGSSNGNDSSESEMGNDSLIGGYSEIRPILEIITLPPRPPYPRPSFTDTIDGELFSSGASSVEATLLLPAVQSALEAARDGIGFITGGNGNDSIYSGGQDTVFGGGVGDDYFNARFSDTSSPLPFPATNLIV